MAADTSSADTVFRPELLAPAGSLETALAAFAAGADAVYLGLGKFNARSRAENFTPDRLARLTDARADTETARESLRSPHVFEFLGLASKDVWEESDLEQAIIGHLQTFILEMGLGFCFEARQKKILIDGRYHKIDLVFYHRILKCHVLVELKAKRFGYEDAAQLSVYMAHYRKHEMQPDDNPPVGILLCTEAGAEMAEYVSTFVDPGLFVAKYEVQLPPKERIAAFLKRENARNVPAEGNAP